VSLLLFFSSVAFVHAVVGLRSGGAPGPLFRGRPSGAFPMKQELGFLGFLGLIGAVMAFMAFALLTPSQQTKVVNAVEKRVDSVGVEYVSRSDRDDERSIAKADDNRITKGDDSNASSTLYLWYIVAPVVYIVVFTAVAHHNTHPHRHGRGRRRLLVR
jgi:hypothetical protein